ncbi:DDE-type integrase/transposase/recombinase [Frigoribacterium sp. Leaf172]|uniref:DDE-type integrase/transposase/recombinase n=1 Tax=Frigoribacterium sp. Leaf172 TaxID=1736285 RepID=UPI0009EC338F|nr:DDE-type integrase/transposase/recombinase [Frigoribacterium sp. Leaf172]
MTDTSIGTQIRIDDAGGVIVESHRDRFGIRMSDGSFTEVARTEVDTNLDGRYYFPQVEEFMEPFGAKAIFDLHGPEAVRKLTRVRDLLDWAETGDIPPSLNDEDREHLSQVHVEASNITHRIPVVAPMMGVKPRQAWNRNAAKAKDDGWGMMGETPPKGGVQYPVVDRALRRLVKRAAIAMQKSGQSRLTKKLLLERVESLATDEGLHWPSRTAVNEVAKQVLAPLGTFRLDVKAEDGNATRFGLDYGHVEATYPGEYVLVDSTVLDVHARSPYGPTVWHRVELTVAMDLFSRAIIAIRLSPFSTKGIDIAELFHEMLRPERTSWDSTNNVNLPGVGAPSVLLIDWEGSTLSTIRPVTIVADNGKVYTSIQMRRIARLAGISIQYGRKLKGSDKAHVERFFRSIRTLLLERLQGYKGNRPGAHGKRAEKNAIYPLELLNRIIREVVATVYHCADHRGVKGFGDPGLPWSPLEKLAEGFEDAGVPLLLGVRDLAVQLLPTFMRSINHYRVEYGGRVYRGKIVPEYANRKSSLAGAKGLWPFFHNIARPDVIFFQEPESGRIHELVDLSAPDWSRPFAIETAIRTAAINSASPPRLARGARDQVVANGVNRIISAVDAEHKIPGWKSLMRGLSHDEKFRPDVSPKGGVVNVTGQAPAELEGVESEFDWDAEETW